MRGAPDLLITEAILLIDFFRILRYNDKKDGYYMKYDLILWDFNGTLMDDIDIGITAINRVLDRRSLPLLTGRDEYRSKMGFPIIDYYKRLGFDFSDEPFEIPANEWVREYLSLEDKITLMPDVVTALEAIRGSGARQMILSACESEIMLRELDMLGIRNYFDGIYGLDNVYAASKLELGKRLASEVTGRCVMIGDTEHDYEVACGIGADCVLYLEGHGAPDKLRALPCQSVDSFLKLPPILGI